MSLIASMRSSRLKFRRLEQEQEDDGLTLTERFHEFVMTKGDVFILPYLDNYDKDRFGAGKFLRLTTTFISLLELADSCAVSVNFQDNTDEYQGRVYGHAKTSRQR